MAGHWQGIAMNFLKLTDVFFFGGGEEREVLVEILPLDHMTIMVCGMW